MKILSVGMAFCDIPLCPSPKDIMELDNFAIDTVVPHTGGDALTVAVVLSKMGEEVSLNAKVGNDSNGKFVLEELKKNGVNIDQMEIEDNYATATSYQLIEMNGQRHFLVDGKINQLLKNRDVTEEAIDAADLVFFGSALALPGMDDEELSALFRRAQEKGKITAMDASVAVKDNADCKMDLLRKTLQYTDIFIPSYEEASYLAEKKEIEEIIEAFKGFSLKVFGIKLGEKGCILTDFKQTIQISPYPGLKVVDTTGAGDCFMGGFLCAYLKGWDLKKCGQFASAVSAFGISAIGPSSAVPDFDTVYQFMVRQISEMKPEFVMNQKYNNAYEKLMKKIEKRSETGSLAALGYTSNLDVLCDFQIEKLNELLEQYLPDQNLESMRAVKKINTMEDLLTSAVYYCMNGIGGEVDIEDVELVKQSFAFQNGMGGTAVQAALALAAIDADTLVHLTDDSKEVCDILDCPDIFVAMEDGRLGHTGQIQAKNPQEVHMILQFQKGGKIRLGSQEIVIPCSNRLILTKNTVNEWLPFYKPYFDWIENHAERVSSNVLSSFNCILDPLILEERLNAVKEHITKYHQKNPDGIVYFEDAHYHDAAIRKMCVETVYPLVDILSMNEEELEYTLRNMYNVEVDIDSIISSVEGVEFLRSKFGIKKGIIVHTKDYAMFAGDAKSLDIENGLMYGNLLATAKAANGCYGTKEMIKKVLELQPGEKGLKHKKTIEQSQYSDHVILVPTKYIDKPKYTIGLGDSFTGGVQMCF